MNITVTSDGYFNLKDIMKSWGHKNGLSTDEVLSAVGEFMFKRVHGEHRAHFLVYQADLHGSDILLSTPEDSVQ